MSAPELIRLPALLAQTGLTLGSVRGFVARGELRPIKVGRAVYFDRAAVRHLIESARRQRPPAISPPMAA